MPDWMQAVVAADPGAMTAAELRCYRDRLGVTLEWLAGRLGVADRTVRRWEAEATTIPDGIAREVHGLLEAADEELDAMLADVHQAAADSRDPVVVTYRSDQEYQADRPGVGWPASWHRAQCARLAEEVPGLRIVYRDAR